MWIDPKNKRKYEMARNENGIPISNCQASCCAPCASNGIVGGVTGGNGTGNGTGNGSCQNGCGGSVGGVTGGNGAGNGTGNGSCQNGCGGTVGGVTGGNGGNHNGCGGRGDCLDMKHLAYVYAPDQRFRMLYSAKDALSHGTLFEELYKPMGVYGNE